jgi:transcriptional regulator with XRE-family HTH domain
MRDDRRQRRGEDERRRDLEKQQRAEAFTAELKALMNQEDWTQSVVAKRTGYTQQGVSDWFHNGPPLDPQAVFAIERDLGLPPGYLSCNLGYVPLGASEVPAAIMNDDRLPKDVKRSFLSMYRSMVARSETSSERLDPRSESRLRHRRSTGGGPTLWESPDR